MSIRHIAWAFDQDIKSGSKFVLVALANYADEDGCCYPSQERIARDTGQGVSTVRSHLKALEDTGLIERTHRYRQDGTRTSDAYRIVTPTAEIKRKPRQRPTRRSRKHYRQNPAVDYRQNSANLPPESGGEPSGEPSVSSVSSLRSETGRGPVVDKSITETSGEAGRLRRNAAHGVAAIGSVLGSIAGTASPTDPLHRRRTQLMAEVQRVAWLGSTPPLRPGDTAESARRHEARLLGELLAGASDGEVTAALAGARAHLGPGTPFRLQLLAGKTRDGRPLFRIFSTRFFNSRSGPMDGVVLAAIRAAMTGGPGIVADSSAKATSQAVPA